MPRSQADLTRAIDVAAELFRTEGFERASIEDVVRATGFNRYALYQAFGGKRELYEAALDRFHDQMMTDLRDRLSEPGVDPLVALRDHFVAPLQDMIRDNDAPGSLLCQAAFEVAPSCDAMKARVTGYLDEKSAVITEALQRAADEGRLRTELAPEAASAMLMNTMFGLAAQAHAGFGGDNLIAVLDAAFAALTPPPR